MFRQDSSDLYSKFENSLRSFQIIHRNWSRSYKSADMRYRMFPSGIIGSLWGYQFFDQPNQGVAGFQQRVYGYRSSRFGRGGMLGGGMLKGGRGLPEMQMDKATAAPPSANQKLAKNSPSNANESKAESRSRGNANRLGNGTAGAGPDLSQVTARKNLNETAFFFPHLISNKDGEVKMEFSMPEALTEWKFMGFAHDKELRGGFITDTVVTAKDLMIQPNPPRFVREGDELELTVKVSNQSATNQTGTVRLSLADARTAKSVDKLLGNADKDLKFDIPSKESRSFYWRIKVPDDMGFLTYKAVGSTGRLSDGEAGHLPVLSRRILVTESMPLPIRGAQTKKFDFAKLRKSGDSDTLKHQSLSVQMVSNPSWYAVMALPYLMEYPHQCSEQTFNRLYANALARHIANSDPNIRRVFDVWKNTPGDVLDSPLEKNQDLK